jgi:hypothetical protein
MKYLQTIAFALMIGSILVASTYSHQEALAMEDDKIIEKMIDANEKLSDLNSDFTQLDEITMSKISFKINQIKNILLEINNANDGNNEKVDEIYTYLSENYAKSFEKYENDIKKYQKDNGLTIQERKLVSEVFKNKLIFENTESQQDVKKLERALIEKAVKETKSKKDYQKLINKIGVKLANDANGGMVEKVHHKLAVKEIIESKKWGIVIPAIDRVIIQTNDDQAKEKLKEIKNNIEKILEKREKQSNNGQIFSLKTDKTPSQIESIQFNPHEIKFGGILEQVGEEDILSSLIDSEMIISEYESQQDLESAIIESETTYVIEPVFDSQLIGSLEEVTEISDEDDDQLEKEREKQRKDAREKKSNNSSDQAKKVQKSPGNSDSKDNDKGKGSDKGKKKN